MSRIILDILLIVACLAIAPVVGFLIWLGVMGWVGLFSELIDLF